MTKIGKVICKIFGHKAPYCENGCPSDRHGWCERCWAYSNEGVWYSSHGQYKEDYVK